MSLQCSIIMQSCRVSIFLNIRICSPVFYENELLINDSQRELKNHCIFVAYLWVVIGKPKWGFRSDLVFLMIKWPSLFIIFVIQPNLFLMSISYDVKPVSNCFRVVVCLNSSLEKFSWLVQRWVFYSWRSICCLNLIFYWNIKHIQSNGPQTHDVLQDYIFRVEVSRG